ncbi:MAG: recombinase family protein, partial [Longimicrobiales bacterium]|nr:recombinase family protein [Longimicrobiales bacterium]
MEGIRVDHRPLHLRVSTDGQAREGYSIGAQRDRLLAFAQAQDWSVVEIYSDEGVSGTKLDRPALSRLRRDAKAKRFDLVLVWKVDRLSRKVGHLAALVEELDQAGVSFRSVTEPFDTSHAAGWAFMQLLGVFAELVRENIRERAKLGIQKRVESGLIHGRPAMIGYRNTAKGVWEVVPEEAQVVRWIFDRYLAGRGALWIAQRLKEGVPELPADVLEAQFGRVALRSVVDRLRWIVRNPIYAGYAPLGEEKYPGRHEAVVDPATWQKVQALIDQRLPLGSRAKTSRYILSGRIFCGACGEGMYGYRQPNRSGGTVAAKPFREYYICKNSSQMKGTSRSCDNWGVDRGHAEAQVLAALRRLSADSAAELARAAEDPGAEELRHRRRDIITAIAGLERRQRNLYRALEEAPDLDHTILARVRSLSEEQKRLAGEMAAVERELRTGGSGLSREEVMALLADVPRLLDEAEPDQLRELVRTLVRRVVVHPRDVPG